jgi:hypothetical protein
MLGMIINRGTNWAIHMAGKTFLDTRPLHATGVRSLSLHRYSFSASFYGFQLACHTKSSLVTSNGEDDHHSMQQSSNKFNIPLSSINVLLSSPQLCPNSVDFGTKGSAITFLLTNDTLVLLSFLDPYIFISSSSLLIEPLLRFSYLRSSSFLLLIH